MTIPKREHMRNPYRRRIIDEPPKYYFFKPAGIPTRKIAKIDMSLDEYEALRLADFQQLEHLEASKQMDISRPTFTRLIKKARYKVAQSLIEGHALKIVGGNVDLINTLHACQDCGEFTRQPVATPFSECPDCGSTNTEDLANRHVAIPGPDEGGENE